MTPIRSITVVHRIQLGIDIRVYSSGSAGRPTELAREARTEGLGLTSALITTLHEGSRSYSTPTTEARSLAIHYAGISPHGYTVPTRRSPRAAVANA